MNYFHINAGDVDTALKLSYEILDMDPERIKAWNVRDKAEHFLHHTELEPPVIAPTKDNKYHVSSNNDQMHFI